MEGVPEDEHALRRRRPTLDDCGEPPHPPVRDGARSIVDRRALESRGGASSFRVASYQSGHQAISARGRAVVNKVSRRGAAGSRRMRAASGPWLKRRSSELRAGTKGSKCWV